MKQELPQTAVYGILAVAIAALIFIGYRLMGPTQADKAASSVIEVSARLGKAHGDASKLSPEDQEFIKKHPNTFKTIDSARFAGPMGKPSDGQPHKQEQTSATPL